MNLIGQYDRIVRRSIIAKGGRSVMHDVAGHRIHCYEIDGRGPGPPLVLLHGLGGSANTFALVMFGLRAGWKKIYVPDLPGHGFSPFHHSDSPRDVRGMYDVFRAFLDQVVRVPAAIAGNSMGGAIAVQTAIDRPERTPALALIAPAGTPFGADHLNSLRKTFTPKTRRDAMKFLDRLLHRRPIGAWIVASEIREVFDSAAVRHILKTALPDDTLAPDQVRALRMPISFIWGESEKILPASGLRFFREHLPPHAHIAVLQRCGHVPMMERPRKVITMLNELGREAARVLQSPLHGAPSPA